MTTQIIEPSRTSSVAFQPFPLSEVEGSIPQRFENQVRRFPHRTAVSGGGTVLTYEALNRAANRVAHTIARRSGDATVPIAVSIGHRPELLAAVLGVLKSGHFLVALNPASSAGRNAEQLEESGARLMVTDSAGVERARTLGRSGRHVISIDALQGSPGERNLELPIRPRDPAYLVHTSGSTGRPIALVHSHRCVLHNVLVHTNVVRIAANDGITLLANWGTGQAATDTWIALLNGASLFMWDLRANGASGAADWLACNDITIYRSSASVFRHLMSLLDEAVRFPRVRLVKLGSEPVLRSDFNLFCRHFPHPCRLLNALSSTEVPTFRMFLADRGTQFEGTALPVGYAVPGKEVALLDPAGRVVEGAGEGEIAVKSRYLSSGYWRDPDLTASAFLADQTDPRATVFRTRDLGRRAADGCLVYLGRRDRQVKVRGFRIQPLEVESAMVDLGCAKAVAVEPRGDRNGETMLVAYVVPRGAELDPAEIRRTLRERLPDHMIPQLFVFLKELPRTAGGKLDRSALPAPAAMGPAKSRSDGGPQTDLETALVALWERVLGVSSVRVDDDFFRLGGHSLHAAGVFAWIADTLGTRLSPESLYEAPTVASLAGLLERRMTFGEERLAPQQPAGHQRHRHRSLVELAKGGSKQPFFLMPPVKGLVSTYRSLVPHFDAERPLYAFQAPDMAWSEAVLSLQEAALWYTTEIREVQPYGPYRLGGYSMGGKLAFDVARRLIEAGERVSHLILFDSGPPRPRYRRWRSWHRELVDRSTVRALVRLGPLGRRALVRKTPNRAQLMWRAMGRGATGVRELRDAIYAAYPEWAAREPLDGLSRGQLIRWLSRRRDTDPMVCERFVRALKIHKKNAMMARSFTSSWRFPGTITLFLCEGNQESLGWQKYVEHPLKVYSFPIEKLQGRRAHWWMFSAANVPLFAETLNRALDSE